MAAEAAGIRYVHDRGGGCVGTQGRRGIGNQIRILRTWQEVHTPAMAGKRSQDDRKGFEIDKRPFEGLVPWLHGSIEDGPGLQRVVPLKANAGEIAGCTVEAITTHDPASFDLVAIAVTLDIRENVVVRADGEPDQAGRSIHLATVLMEMAGEDRLGGLFG